MRLSANEIHLWCAHDEQIQDLGLLSRYHALLSAEERAQQRRFHFPRHRHQYLVTRALVRTVMSRYEPTVAPSQWRFERNGYGKPHVVNSGLKLALRFNLSHSDGIVVMAVMIDDEVGVDVEYMMRPRGLLDLARHSFSAHEFGQLSALPRDHRRDRFFDFWTLKEAYIKARGMGLSLPLDQFSFTFPGRGRIAIEFDPRLGDEPGLWRFWQFRPSATHKVALATRASCSERDFAITAWQIIPLIEQAPLSWPMIARSGDDPPTA